MTIQYKNQGINLNYTGKISVLTCPSNATILIKQIQINHGSGGAVNLNVQVTDSSAAQVLEFLMRQSQVLQLKI